MQASKIKIGDEYAVRVKGQLARCRVSQVTTVRKGAHPSDFTHTIIGYIDGASHTFNPDHVLGPYEEHAELVAKKEAEDARKKAEADAKAKTSADLVALLYKLTGQRKAEGKYGHMFDSRYSGGVEITNEGARLLLDVLSQRPALKVV